MNQLTPSYPVSSVDALFISPRESAPAADSAVAPDIAETRFALRVAAALSERSSQLEIDVGERLRFAREQALERARSRRSATADSVSTVGVTRSGVAVLGSVGPQWWGRFAVGVPVVALLVGLLAIDQWQDKVQISAAAEVDLPLLSDDLPPTAYSDAGFAEFLKTPGE